MTENIIIVGYVLFMLSWLLGSFVDDSYKNSGVCCVHSIIIGIIGISVFIFD